VGPARPIRRAGRRAPRPTPARGGGRGPRAHPPGPASPPVHDPREELEEPSDPEGRPRGRHGRYPGDDDRSQAGHDEEGEDPPTDGRQLLGWAANQVPDAKGKVIGYGKKRGFPSRILDWRPDQVAAAYRFARARPARSRR
jgi:hypothetical protein